MHCQRFDDPGLFLEEAKPFLAEREAENTVLVGAALRCQHGDAVLMTVHDRSRVCMAAVMTPPFNLLLSAGGDPAALPVLGAAVLGAGVAPRGVVGPRSLAESFARWWCRRRPTGSRPSTIWCSIGPGGLHRLQASRAGSGALRKATSSFWPTGMRASCTARVSAPTRRPVHVRCDHSRRRRRSDQQRLHAE